MGSSFLLAAQISTNHSDLNALPVRLVQQRLQQAHELIPLSYLIIGAQEAPEIFEAVLQMRGVLVGEVYLWYNLLSDYPGWSGDDLVINFRGEHAEGWKGWDEGSSSVKESFLFGCPNNPHVRRKTLAGLEALLEKYSFDGVFLDKFRFPSPANGLEMVLSCFCPYCWEAAGKQGLDLAEVRKCLQVWRSPEPAHPSDEGQANWLEGVIGVQTPLQKFICFRANSILSLVEEVHSLARRLGRKVALDLFAPAFAMLVGQDYHSLRHLADWCKPMTYRRAYGPAGIRLELQGLVSGIERIFHLSSERIMDWAAAFHPWFKPDGYQQLIASAVPLEWVRREIEQSVRTLAPSPVLFGLETVSFPGVIHTTPSMVREMVAAGLEGSVQGAVISWDLMHTPLENLLAIKDSLP